MLCASTTAHTFQGIREVKQAKREERSKMLCEATSDRACEKSTSSNSNNKAIYFAFNDFIKFPLSGLDQQCCKATFPMRHIALLLNVCKLVMKLEMLVF